MPYHCPRCASAELQPTRDGDDRVWVCSSCRGVLVGRSFLERELGEDPLARLQKATKSFHRLRCPITREPMTPYRTPSTPPIEIDYSEKVDGFWLDRAEMPGVRQAMFRMLRSRETSAASRAAPAADPTPAPAEPPSEPEGEPGREGIAARENPGVFQTPDRWLGFVDADSAETSEGFFFLLTALPREAWVTTRATPWVTWILMATLVIVSVMTWLAGSAPELTFGSPVTDLETLQHYALYAGRGFEQPASLFTYAGLHFYVLELALALYLLWSFGDNVEDAVGPVSYAILAVCFVVFAGAFHSLFGSNQLKPVGSAAGLVAGMMGVYLVLYPAARIRWTFPWVIGVFLGLFGLSNVSRYVWDTPAFVWPISWGLALGLLLLLGEITGASLADPAWLLMIGGGIIGVVCGLVYRAVVLPKLVRRWQRRQGAIA